MAIETSDAKALPHVDLTAPNPILGDKAPKTMEQVRAERYAKSEATAATPGAPVGDAGGGSDPGAATAAAPAVPPDAGKAAPGATSATIDMDEATLKAATQLSREAREAKARAREFEAKAKEAEPLMAAKALVAHGKHLEAIKALGIDLNAAVAETLAAPGEAAEPTAEAKELARLAAETEALKARDAEREKRDKELEAERHAEAKRADVKAVGEYVKKEATKYPFLSRNEAWVADAYEGAVEAHATLVKEHKRELTADERHKLVLTALEEAEAQHVANAKLYGAPAPQNPTNVKVDPPPSAPSARPATFSGDLRGGTVTPVAKQRTRMTFSEAKRARREASNG